MKDKVTIERKVLFEICDAILSHDGYSDRNYCPEGDCPCSCGEWNEEFVKKVIDIRYNM